MRDKRILYLEDGSCFEGYGFGYEGDCEGEVVFSTGMVGYTEGLTDPSYLGQILVLTYPLIGNYGVADGRKNSVFGATRFESEGIKVRGLVVSSYIDEYSHWSADFSLDTWLKNNKIPGVFGIDTRHLAIKLRERGVLLGYIAKAKRKSFTVSDPNRENLAAQTSTQKVIMHGTGKTKILLIDCGVKRGIIEGLIRRGVTVYQVPWNYQSRTLRDFTFDGVVVSNGPGDPKMVGETITIVSELMNRKVPILGICLGNQILALSSGADTYKLKFGHRSHNQPVMVDGTKQCYLTTHNHGFAVNTSTLQEGWREWFRNLNDGTNEGIRHTKLPFMSTQFHPEGRPGPDDTSWVFDEFLSKVKNQNSKIKMTI